MFAESGKYYTGDFNNNLMHGKGTMVFPDNSRYEGDWKEGKMAGQGTKIYSNGDRYVG